MLSQSPQKHAVLSWDGLQKAQGEPNCWAWRWGWYTMQWLPRHGDRTKSWRSHNHRQNGRSNTLIFVNLFLEVSSEEWVGFHVYCCILYLWTTPPVPHKVFMVGKWFCHSKLLLSCVNTHSAFLVFWSQQVNENSNMAKDLRVGRTPKRWQDAKADATGLSFKEVLVDKLQWVSAKNFIDTSILLYLHLFTLLFHKIKDHRAGLADYFVLSISRT